MKQLELKLKFGTLSHHHSIKIYSSFIGLIFKGKMSLFLSRDKICSIIFIWWGKMIFYLKTLIHAILIEGWHCLGFWHAWIAIFPVESKEISKREVLCKLSHHLLDQNISHLHTRLWRKQLFASFSLYALNNQFSFLKVYFYSNTLLSLVFNYILERQPIAKFPVTQINKTI